MDSFPFVKVDVKKPKTLYQKIIYIPLTKRLEICFDIIKNTSIFSELNNRKEIKIWNIKLAILNLKLKFECLKALKKSTELIFRRIEHGLSSLDFDLPFLLYKKPVTHYNMKVKRKKLNTSN